jgi:hypothetical protein
MENSKISNAITAKRSIDKSFDTTIENCLGRNVFGMNQEKLLVQTISQFFSVVFQPKPERTNFPKISLHSCSLPKLKAIMVASN